MTPQPLTRPIDDPEADRLERLERERLEREMNAYGLSAAETLTSIKTSFRSLPEAHMSILSDAQELMAMGDLTKANRYINIAKLIVQTIVDESQGNHDVQEAHR